jgi:hypothetical protein
LYAACHNWYSTQSTAGAKRLSKKQKAEVTKHADELYAKYYTAATEAAKVDKELRLRRALWSNHSILKARWLDHNKETGNKKKSIGRSIKKLKKVLEEHVLILNSRIALGLAVGPLAVATDWTSASFEPPAGWQAQRTSQGSTSEMEEEFVAAYDRLNRCNEQSVLNIHQIRSLDLMISVLVDRHGKNVQKHLDASETHGELAKAFHATRELALMHGLREQFDKANFKLPPLPKASPSTDLSDAGSEPELSDDGDAGADADTADADTADADTADEEDADDAASLTSGTGGCDSDRDEDDQLDD